MFFLSTAPLPCSLQYSIVGLGLVYPLHCQRIQFPLSLEDGCVKLLCEQSSIAAILGSFAKAHH